MAIFSLADEDRNVWRAFRRERFAFTAWWCMIWLAESAALLYLLAQQSSLQNTILLGILLIAAAVAPLLAYWSLKAPPRATHAPPKSGASYAEWLADVRAIGRFLLYQEVSGDVSPEMKARIRAARREMANVLGAHPLSDDLERLSKKLRTGIIAEWKAWRWQQTLPMLKQLRRELLAADDDPYILQQQVLWKAVNNTLNLCMPHLLASERILGELACIRLATQTSQQVGEDDISEILLATLYALEWADISLPWRPEDVVQRADAFPLFQSPVSIHGESSTASDAPSLQEESADGTPEEADETGEDAVLPTAEHIASFSIMAKAADAPSADPSTFINGIPPRAPRRRRRYRHRPPPQQPIAEIQRHGRKSKRRRHRTRTRKDILQVGHVLGSFWQRLRYTIHAWFLYR